VHALFSLLAFYYTTDLSVRPSRSGVLFRRMKVLSCCLQYQMGHSF